MLYQLSYAGPPRWAQLPADKTPDTSNPLIKTQAALGGPLPTPIWSAKNYLDACAK
ncbi:MAG: hypothetical protein WKF84_24135 [Pyrinomonadaceae bacterium]